MRLENAYSTAEAKEDVIGRYILPRLGDLRLDQVDYAVIDDFRLGLSTTRNARLKAREQMLAAKTINNVLTVLEHILEIGRIEGFSRACRRSAGCTHPIRNGTSSRSWRPIGWCSIRRVSGAR